MTSSKVWFLYVLRCVDDTLYCGVTTDVQRRLHEHNNSARGAKYTSTRRPVELVWTREYSSRSIAQSAEYKFKKLSRNQKIKTIYEELEF